MNLLEAMKELKRDNRGRLGKTKSAKGFIFLTLDRNVYTFERHEQNKIKIQNIMKPDYIDLEWEIIENAKKIKDIDWVETVNQIREDNSPWRINDDS